MNTASPA